MLIILKFSLPPAAASSRRRERGGDRECQSYKYFGFDLRDRSEIRADMIKRNLRIQFVRSFVHRLIVTRENRLEVGGRSRGEETPFAARFRFPNIFE